MPEPNREKEIFAAALDIELPVERNRYVEQACAGDAALVQRVHALLKASESASQFLPGTPDQTALISPAVPIAEGLGTVIDRYKLLQQIGEGGFGVVYIAEQREPVKRRVALKIIKLGMDTKQVVARFEAERQALALMDHANIAKVFDAGATEAGRPYFVMELVKGIPITKYCDDHNLSTTDRVKLFIKVCLAVQHAHQKGIIHRDIKPSNILVTLHDGVPVPKVIDFGIAKATQQELTEKTLFTEFQQFIGTPAYMSPEQAEFSGLDIDTRSDIYSLGVLLYELLTGSPPFDSKELMSAGLDGMRQIIKTKEPLRPSTKLSQTLVAADVSPRKHSGAQPATRNPQPEDVSADSRRRLQVKETITLLRGDLDWIVMKALEKDRQRRYETANGLAADLQRHLNHEPVTAVAPTLFYQLTKFYQRNRKFARFAGAFGVLLLIATAFSFWQAQRASRNARIAVGLTQEADTQRQRAEENEQLANASKETAVKAEQETRERLYAADMIAVQHALQEVNLGFARDILRHHIPRPGEPHLRGFEWRYFWQQAQGDQIHTFRGHSNLVHCVRFSPDGRLIASGDWDGKVILWDSLERRALSVVQVEAGTICSIAFNQEGRMLAIGGNDDVSLWRLDDKQRPELWKRHPAKGARVAFIPNTTRLVIGEGYNFYGSNAGSVQIWDYDRDEVVRALRETGGMIALTKDGGILFAGLQNNTLSRWDLASEAPPIKTKFERNLSSLACSPDGRWLIACRAENGHLAQLFSGLTLEPVTTLIQHRREITIYGAAFGPDNLRAVTCHADQLVRLWNLADPTEPVILRGHGNEIWDACFSPDGKYLVSCGKDQTVRLWDLDRAMRSSLITEFSSSLQKGEPVFSPDGKQLALRGPGNTVGLWSAETQQRLASFTNTIQPLAFAKDGTQLVTIDGSMSIKSYDLASGQLESVVALSQAGGMSGAMALSPDGLYLLAGKQNDEVAGWKVETGEKVIQFHAPGGTINGLRFSSDNRHFITAHADHRARLWRFGTFELARELHGHKDQVPSADISPHGQFLATGSFDSKTKIWDPSSGEELMVFEGHKRGVFEVKFAPDGNTLATGSHDGSIRFWNLKTGREVGSVSFTNQIQHVAFSADGSCMAVVESGVGVHLLKAPFPSVPQFGTNILPPSMVGLANDLDSGDSPTLAASSTNQASQSPVIIRQPQDQVIALGGPARFEVQAKADEPGQRYQWFREAQLIPDATNTTWTIPNVHLSDAGSYSVAIANGEGWIRSRTANLVLKIIEDSSGIVLAYDEFDGTGGEGWIDEEPNPASKGFGQFSNATGNWKSRRFSQEPFTNVLWMALTMKMSAPADDYYFLVPGNTQGVQRDLQFFNTGFSNQKTNLGMHTWDVYSGFDQLDLQTFLYWFDSTSGRTEYAVWILAGNGGKSDLSLGQPLARSWVNQVTPGVNSYYRTFGADGQQRLLVDRIGVGTSAAAALGWTKEDK